MKTKIKLLIAFCLFGYGTVQAQEIITTGGDYQSSSSGSLTWTIGEPVSETFSGNGKYLTQGFEQPAYLIVSVKELPENCEISVFPNPTSDFLQLKIGDYKVENMQYQLYDMNGKLLLQKNIESTETGIPFAEFMPSAYFLKIIKERKKIKVFKIIKY